MVARKASHGSSSIDPIRSIPALFTNTSMKPASERIAAIAPATDLSESTSSCTIETGSFSFSACWRNELARSGFRRVAYTLWPALASTSAVSRPIPELQPVTSTHAMIPPLKANVYFGDLEGGKSYTRLARAIAQLSNGSSYRWSDHPEFVHQSRELRREERLGAVREGLVGITVHFNQKRVTPRRDGRARHGWHLVAAARTVGWICRHRQV